jgi:hypothetical protein
MAGGGNRAGARDKIWRAKMSKTSRVPKWLLACASIAGCAILPSTSTVADPSSEEASASALIQALRTRPATTLEIGVAQLRLDIAVALLANRPEIFHVSRFNYLAIEVDENKSIDVQLSHRAPSSTEQDLIDECKKDIDLEFSSIALAPPSLGNSEMAIRERRRQMCLRVKAAFLDFTLEENAAVSEANICNVITFWAHVESSVSKVKVACKKRFFEDAVESWLVE